MTNKRLRIPEIAGKTRHDTYTHTHTIYSVRGCLVVLGVRQSVRLIGFGWGREWQIGLGSLQQYIIKFVKKHPRNNTV